jgi:hypothetical protein
MSEKHDHDSVNAKVWMADKLCLVTIATEASVMLAIPVIATGLPERDLTTPYVLQMASGEILLILKKALVKLTGVPPTKRLVVCCQYQ